MNAERYVNSGDLWQPHTIHHRTGVGSVVDELSTIEMKKRLKAARRDLGLSQAAMAEKLDMPLGTLKSVENEKSSSTPGGDTLLKYAAIGVDPSWILLGGKPAARGAAYQRNNDIDRELLGRVTDAIAKLYKAEGVHLPDVELGRLSADKYQEIIESGVLPEDYPAALAMAVANLRKQIRMAAADPASSKRRASE